MGLVDGAYLFAGWLVGWLVGWGAVGCGSGVVVVWVVTDLFGGIVVAAVVTVVVAGAVAGFGPVVRALFVVVIVVDEEEGVWERGVGTIMTNQCSCGVHLIFGVYIFTNGICNYGWLAEWLSVCFRMFPRSFWELPSLTLDMCKLFI
jgi:hypothetical protein